VANPRAATIEDLQAIFAQHAPRVQVYSAAESAAAMDLALDLADPRDLVCATGSLYLAGEVLRWAAARGNKEVAATIEGVDH
jgi:dihydrofolate synthase/folylpolyglutamate synthase